MPKLPLNTVFQFKHIYVLAFLSVFLLSGCGGSSDSDDIEFLSSKIDINVALASNGGRAFANYNSVSAPKVNDGDTSTSEYWSGNVVGDAVTVDFGRSRFLNEIRIYTNEAIIAISLIELSINGKDWFSTAQTSGSDINCQTLSTATNKITCTYSSRQESRFLRFTTKRELNPNLVNVYELEAIGY